MILIRLLQLTAIKAVFFLWNGKLVHLPNTANVLLAILIRKI